MENPSVENKHQNKIGQLLKTNIKATSKVSVISSYFTIYAYHHLKAELEDV